MIGELQALNALIYNTFLIPVIFFSVLFYFLTLVSLVGGRKRTDYVKPPGKAWPRVTVQIPVYNDPVAVRCLEHCLAFDYPKDRYDIIVADDSDDPKTRAILDRFVEGKSQIQLVRRKNRDGWKAGALNAVLPETKGEYIVVFDSDFTPGEDFLRKIITPFFSDDQIAVVQSRMGYLNASQNAVTKFAALTLMIFHQVILPVYSRTRTIFFCGTHGAIKKRMLEEVGGWNGKSITEDAELSIKMLAAGYRTVYLPNVRVDGELPYTLDSFIKQQSRWTYGLCRAILDNMGQILSSPRLLFRQRFTMLLLFAMYLIVPFVLITALTGQLGWVINEPKPIELKDVVNFSTTMALTFGYGAMGLVALGKERKLKRSVVYIPLLFAFGVMLSLTNLYAFLRAVTGRQMGWIKTPKFGSLHILDMFWRLFGKRV